MKELSKEEKAKRYDEAIPQLKGLLDGIREEKCDIMEEDIIRIFPELKESKDEKIRGAIIDYLKDNNLIVWAAWLEKQGDTFTKKDVDDAYLEGVTDTKNAIEKQYEETYQIRKDIATFIFNYRGDIKDRAKWMNYLGIKVSFVEKQAKHKPTDEEMNILLRTEYEKGRADAIAEFLKEWSEDDEDYYDAIIAKLEVTQDDASLTDNQMEFLKSLKDKIQLQPKQEWSEEDDIGLSDALWAVEQARTIAKDENDMGNLWYAERFLKSLKERVGCEVNCTTTKEWSEEDEEMYKEVLTDIIYAKNNLEEKECIGLSNRAMKAFNWFSKRYKSLRPQTTWKPSWEQLNALEDAIEFLGCTKKVREDLKSLHEQLKKLRG